MIIGMMLAGLLWFAGAILAIVLAIHSVWRAVAAPIGMPREAGCGSCGYELSTVAGGRCSECGADLLKAGVTTRRNAIKSSGSMAGAIMGWTFIMVAVTTIALYAVAITGMMPVLAAGGAIGTPYSSNFKFTPDPYVVDEQGTVVQAPSIAISVALDVVGNYGMPASSGSVDINLSSRGKTAILRCPDVTTNAWSILGVDGTEIAAGVGLGQDEVLTAMDAVGLSLSDHADLGAYATEVTQLANTALNNPMTYETTYAATTTRGQPAFLQTGGTSNFGMSPLLTGANAWDMLAPLGISAVGLVVWIFGIVFIARRRRTLLGESGSVRSGSPPGIPGPPSNSQGPVVG